MDNEMFSHYNKKKKKKKKKNKKKIKKQHPKRMKKKPASKRASKKSRENEVLGLGPFLNMKLYRACAGRLLVAVGLNATLKGNECVLRLERIRRRL